MSEHLECRQFDVLECVPESDAKMLGSFIVGIPTMTVREFQNGYPSFELESAILESISSEERRKIGLHLWVKLKAETRFIVRSRRTDLPRRSREEVLGFLEVRQGGLVKVLLEPVWKGHVFVVLRYRPHIS